MKRIITVVLLLMLPFAAVAQDEDGQGYLERLLQDSLSGAGRTVRIVGFEGALSSRATIERLTIADDQGVWLDASGLALDWSRASLLRGRIEVNELSAQSVSMPRKPIAEETVDVPAPEATEFALPDLPVSLNVEKLDVARAEIGADVIGQDAVLSLTGAAQLADGAGTVDLVAQRLDGPEGQFTVDLGYDAEENASILIAATEDENGIVSGLIGLPQRPSIDLKIEGDGPIDDLTVDIALRTDQALRLGGQVTLRGQALDVDLGGDLRALIDETYHPLIGDDARLVASAAKAEDGTITLSDLSLDARSVDLTGRAVIAPSGLPSEIALQGTLADPEGAPLVLAPDVTVDGATIDVTHDAGQGPDWSGQVVLRGLQQAAVSLPEAVLNGRGQITEAAGEAPSRVTAQFDFETDGLQMADAGLQALLGPEVTGAVSLDAVDGAPLELRDLVIDALAFDAAGQATIQGLDSGYVTDLDLSVDVDDLKRAAEVSGMDLGGAAKVQVAGQVTPLSGAFDLRVTGRTMALELGQEQLDGLAGGDGAIDLAVKRDETGVTIDQMDLDTDGVRLKGSGTIGSAETDFGFEALVKDFARLGQGGAGRADLSGQVTLAGPELRNLSVKGDLSGNDGIRVPMGADILSLSEGRIDLTAGSGRWRVDTELDNIAHPQGRLGQAAINGAGTYSQTEGGTVTALAGQLSAALTGAKPADAALARALGEDVGFNTSIEYAEGAPLELKPLQLSGADYGALGDVSVDMETQVATIDLTATVQDAGRFSGLAGRPLQGRAQLQIAGTASADTMDLTVTGKGSGLDLGEANANALLRGDLDLNAHVVRDGASFTFDDVAVNGSNLTLRADGSISDQGKALTAEARIANIAAIVSDIAGPVTLNAVVGGDAQTTTVDASLTGPAGIAADVDGTIAADGTLNLRSTGGIPLSIANPFISPRQVSGQADFDLGINGAAGLEAVNGTITLSDGLFSEPSSGITLSNIRGTTTLRSGTAQIDIKADGGDGGDLAVSGTAGLSAPYQVNAQVDLDDLVLSDPGLYQATIAGQVRFNGPATEGGTIKGNLELLEAELRIPETGAGAAGSIPDIQHVGTPADVRRTLARAGLNETAAPETEQSSSAGFPIDLKVSAPSRIFVRGRGLDAELGGQIRLRGTTSNLIPVGRFDLVRGRLDLLGQRFQFDEGYVSLEGALVPVIRFVVETQQGEVMTYIIVQGEASSPEVSFSSSPSLPEDEVLAQLLFGRDMSRLSAFQALQLANAVAVLAGKGGEGVVAKLRQGFDLDDLDVTTDDEGNAALRAGKYISDNIYTDVTVGASGTAELNLNIDISPSVTARGGVDDDGQSSVGIFFERDY